MAEICSHLSQTTPSLSFSLSLSIYIYIFIYKEMVSSYKVTTCYQMVKWECSDIEHGCIWGLKSLWTYDNKGLVLFLYLWKFVS